MHQIGRAGETVNRQCDRTADDVMASVTGVAFPIPCTMLS